ncbi:MAG: hypothetical protein HC892_03125 [Saprospiraceae bacterium]|nr:hypothetical protein [Saprospiraceae bacterium]
MQLIKEKQGDKWKTIRFNLLVGDRDTNSSQDYWFTPNWRDNGMQVGSGMFFR